MLKEGKTSPVLQSHRRGEPTICHSEISTVVPGKSLKNVGLDFKVSYTGNCIPIKNLGI